MRLAYQRYEDIKEVVAYTLKRGNINSIPICCFQLAIALGIECIPYSSLTENKLSICLQFSEEGFTLDNTIYYNDYQIPTRIRFTIMHEIGHIMLGHLEDDDIAELEANFFAAYILVPPVIVHAHDRTGDIDQNRIRDLFNVSNPVAENSFNSYNNWLRRSQEIFGISAVDRKIYNLFYGKNYAYT